MRFEHELVGETQEKVFQVIEDWLRDEKAKIKQNHPPSYIEASHGSRLQPIGWRKNAKKTITFQLSPEGNNVRVTIDMLPSALNASDVGARSEEARANWNELLTSLWTRFGETSTSAPSAGINWNRVRIRGKWSIGLGFVVLVAGFLLSLVASGLVAVAVVGVLLIVNGAMDYRSAKKRRSSESN